MAETREMSKHEVMKVRHYEHQQKALHEIRLLRAKIGTDDGVDIPGSIDMILSELDARTAP